jgi:predicted permease
MGLFYASIFVIPNRIFTWSAGISLFTKDEKKSWVRSVLLNPCILAVIIGLPQLVLKISLPSFINAAIANMGNCSISLSIIILGSILADVDFRSIITRETLYMSLVRLILLPVCALLALKAVHFPSLPTAVAVVLTGMPVGSTTAILADRYGADFGFASKCVFVTTVLSLITIPVLSIFL